MALSAVDPAHDAQGQATAPFEIAVQMRYALLCYYRAGIVAAGDDYWSSLTNRIEGRNVVQFTLNGETVESEWAGDTPLLWVLRDAFRLKGTKFGCGRGLCGACTVHLDGTATRSCLLPLAAVAGKTVTTIEGLGQPDNLHPLQQRWVELGVPQCGYCQSGQIMNAASFLESNPAPTEQEVEAAMAGNLCRCGCYPSIKRAIMDVAAPTEAVAYFDPASTAAEMES
jgi:isoquinoline 1-oxidoreductase alpha subunit